MTLKKSNSQFYVVGGPVQPDRACYIAREADEEFFRRLADGNYCHVLAPRQTGKTSLAARTANRLRAEGFRVAVVDLAQTGGLEPSESIGRWYYSIAYRIVRELRIRSDMQTWWQEHGGLTNLQRLRSFFREVVLAEIQQPVVVMFDRLEATLLEPLAQDLFGAIRGCYDARATDPDYERLGIAMLGTAAPIDLVRKDHDSPFEISAGIELPDFTKQEMSTLLEGLGDTDSSAHVLAARVGYWTNGHPYMSQKIFRALGRRADEGLYPALVDDLASTLFFAPNSVREEPHLSLIRDAVLGAQTNRIARLNLYGRVCKGAETTAGPDVGVQRELLTCGILIMTDDDKLEVRNRIYAAAFSPRWVNQSLPFGWKGFGASAAMLAFVVALPIWYTEYLPRPYVKTLNAADQDYQVALDAYESLSFLPGFGGTADQLFADFLERQSQRAETLSEVMRIHGRLVQTSGD
ncbi:MAG: AAA-like domain-containing protein, partial [Gammaproteobacteria bacterium]